MTIHLVTFASPEYTQSAKLCVDSAVRHGVKRTHSVLATEPCTERGYGYWKWKPRAIFATMQGLDIFRDPLKDGDILIYADAGIEFINNVHYIIDRMDQDIFLFGNNWEHAHWCKRDVIEEVLRASGYSWPREPPWEFFGKQVQASVIFFRVSNYSRHFVKEWFDWCLFEGGRLIDDSPSRTPNHPEFREHRHDQAILTTVAYRDGLRLHWWPSVYNKGGSPEFVYEKLPEYESDQYPVLFSHHRKRNHEWEVA